MSSIVKVPAGLEKPASGRYLRPWLGGHAHDTWRRAPDDNSFWPLWLAEDIASLAVYTLACEVPPSNWLDPISRRGELSRYE